MSEPFPDDSRFQRNNLDVAPSLYLRQHADNPVWWQDWNAETLAYARRHGKPLLVSVGYATCHWCHVMAQGAFSDTNTADFLNAHFVCVKIDRELRPEIDQFLMEFLQAQSGNGGWPLNVFLYADQRPLFALTYAPVHSGAGYTGFADIAAQVLRYQRENPEGGYAFQPMPEKPIAENPQEGLARLLQSYDRTAGGFGSAQKFPPHSVLLAQLYHELANPNAQRRTLMAETLRAMRRKGLYDHLQGGLFRYCVDVGWTVPHFEKMLYDQALGLWTFALAYRVLGDPEDRDAVLGIWRGLRETFRQGNFFVAAHDADTNHEEGRTYLWSYEELQSILGGDFAGFAACYAISKQGNYEGLNHFHWTGTTRAPRAEALLLAARRKRPQPMVDTKILSGHNALLACALLQVGRLLASDEGRHGEREGLELLRALWAHFWNGRAFLHASLDGKAAGGPYLSDAAAMLLAVTLAWEAEAGWEQIAATLENAVCAFRQGGEWLESLGGDFPPVAARRFDHPIPSGIALAELALTRLALLRGETPAPVSPGDSFAQAFSHLGAMMANNEFHWIKSPLPPDWQRSPPHSLHIRTAGERSICYQGTCRLA